MSWEKIIKRVFPKGYLKDNEMAASLLAKTPHIEEGLEVLIMLKQNYGEELKPSMPVINRAIRLLTEVKESLE